MQKDDVLYYAGSHSTVSTLSKANQSTPVIMDGRSIFSLAQSALRNGKKALSVEKSAYVDGKLPSGWNDDDLDQHILDGMWSMLQSKSSTLNVDGDDEEEDVAEEGAAATVERPETWIFPGWMAYRLLGPRAHNDFRSPLFEIGDWDRNKRTAVGDSKGTGGRADHRKALADQSNTIRLNSVDRGVPLGACKKDMVIIAQAENRAEQRSHECGMLALSQVIESKQKRVAALTKLLEIPGMEGEQKSKILDKIMELMSEIQEKENLMETKSENKRKTSDLIEGFLQQGVGEKAARVGAPRAEVTETVGASNADAVVAVTPRALQLL